MDTDYPYRRWEPCREHLTARIFKQDVDSIYMDELEGRGTMFQLRALKETYDVAVVIHARDGKFTPPERACEVVLHGITQKPAAVSLNGTPLDATHDPKIGILRLSFPDTGKEQKLIVQR